MIDPKLIRENPELVRAAMANRGVETDIAELARMDGQWRHVLQELEGARAELNKASEKAGAELPERERLKKLKHHIKSLEIRIEELELGLQAAVGVLPNIPLPDTPVGTDASQNVVLRESGSKPAFDFVPKHYLDVAEPLGVIDIRSAAKVSGARFGYLKGGAAMLQFALIQYTVSRLSDPQFVTGLVKANNLDIAPAAFLPVVPPVMIRPEMMRAMGFSERAGVARGTDEIYWLDRDDLYLVGTSEQSVGPMHYDEILDAAALPLRYVSYSTCFRREAGAAGKDTRGILRVHQFDKLEMFTVCAPEKSEHEHRLLLACEEALMQGLGLHYRVVRLCTGDIGAASAATYDIETWMPGQNEYRETHSTSNTTDFQSRALKTRYRLPAQAGAGAGKPELVHMLNGTAFAIGRILVAILENYQTAQGTVRVPDILRPYLNGLEELS